MNEKIKGLEVAQEIQPELTKTIFESGKFTLEESKIIGKRFSLYGQAIYNIILGELK